MHVGLGVVCPSILRSIYARAISADCSDEEACACACVFNRADQAHVRSFGTPLLLRIDRAMIMTADDSDDEHE